MIRSKGLEKIKLEELVEELLPQGRALVPAEVKDDLLSKIKDFIEQDVDYQRMSGY